MCCTLGVVCTTWPVGEEDHGSPRLLTPPAVCPAPGSPEGPEQPGRQPDDQQRLRHLPGEGKEGHHQRSFPEDQEHGSLPASKAE